MDREEAVPKGRRNVRNKTGVQRTTVNDRWTTLVTGLRGKHPDLFGSLAIANLKTAKPGRHGMAAQIRLAALARKYVAFAGKQKTLRTIGKLGKFFNRYIAHRRDNDHDTYGFASLHHVCAESTGTLQVVVKNKHGLPGSVRVRTVDGGAKAGDDYEAVDTVLRFSRGDDFGTIGVPILDDDAIEDDEDFFIELVDVRTRKPLYCADTRTRVTITDDDGPEKGEKKMSMEVFARWARLIRGVGSVRKTKVLSAYGRLIGLVGRYVKHCHRYSEGMASAPAPRTGNLSVPMRYQRLILRYRMLLLKRERLATLGKLGQMAWRYLAMKTRPGGVNTHPAVRFRRLVSKYKVHKLKMGRFKT